MSDISKDTGINRGTITRLCNETATRVDLEVIEQLYDYLDITEGELFEIQNLLDYLITKVLTDEIMIKAYEK
ncbi:helix-turn-helix domain-containing protein [Photobacterium damselae subsp. damselae]